MSRALLVAARSTFSRYGLSAPSSALSCPFLFSCLFASYAAASTAVRRFSRSAASCACSAASSCLRARFSSSSAFLVSLQRVPGVLLCYVLASRKLRILKHR